jgi:Fungal N-terminal domain of STAND proteins
MEAVGAGAGLVTLVLFALQSTKAICETIFTIKQGPRQVTQLTSAVENLQQVLTQLLNCRASKEDDAETDLKTISSRIKTCGQDLSRYEKKLREFRISPSDRAAGQA